jgi:hypothetical protein
MTEPTWKDPLQTWRSQCHPTTIDRILCRVPDDAGPVAILKMLDTSYHAGPGTYAALDADRLRSLIDAELARGREAQKTLALIAKEAAYDSWAKADETKSIRKLLKPHGFFAEMDTKP